MINSSDYSDIKISNKKKKFHWTYDETKTFIRIWKEKSGDLRRVKRNLHVVAQMQKMLKKENIDASLESIKNKIHSLKGKYRSEKKVTGPSGESLSDWQHYDEVKEIVGNTINSSQVMEESLSSSYSGYECDSNASWDPESAPSKAAELLLKELQPESPPLRPSSSLSNSSFSFNKTKRDNLILQKLEKSKDDSSAIKEFLENCSKVDNKLMELAERRTIAMERIADKICGTSSNNMKYIPGEK